VSEVQIAKRAKLDTKPRRSTTREKVECGGQERKKKEGNGRLRVVLTDVVRLVVIQTMVSRVNGEVRLIVSRGGGVVVVVRQIRGR